MTRLLCLILALSGSINAEDVAASNCVASSLIQQAGVSSQRSNVSEEKADEVASKESTQSTLRSLIPSLALPLNARLTLPGMAAMFVQDQVQTVTASPLFDGVDDSMPTIAGVASTILVMVLASFWVYNRSSELKWEGNQPEFGMFSCMCCLFCTPLALCFPIDHPHEHVVGPARFRPGQATSYTRLSADLTGSLPPSSLRRSKDGCC